jgi:hypothetical protein
MCNILEFLVDKKDIQEFKVSRPKSTQKTMSPISFCADFIHRNWTNERGKNPCLPDALIPSAQSGQSSQISTMMTISPFENDISSEFVPLKSNLAYQSQR